MNRKDLEFQQIYQEFQPRILRYVTGLVGESEAEDLTQDIFIKAHWALADFRGEAKPSTWLYRIATNSALDRLRSPAYRRAAQKTAFEPSDVVEDEVSDMNPWTGEKTPLVEHQVYRKEMNECIREFVMGLPENYRTVLLLGEFEGFKNNEIAEILGISLDTVKIRLHRAREKLKQELAANCDSSWVDGNEFVPELKRQTRRK
jgi:RNA polymerase sigma-70 factor (ECF subfamily)